MAEQAGRPAERPDEPSSLAGIEGGIEVEETPAPFIMGEIASVERTAYREDVADAADRTGSGTGELTSSSDESREAAGPASGWVDVPAAGTGLDSAGSPTPLAAGAEAGSPAASHERPEASEEEQLRRPESGPSYPAEPARGAGGEELLVDALDPVREPAPPSDDASNERAAEPAASDDAEDPRAGRDEAQGTAQGASAEVQTASEAARETDTPEEQGVPDAEGVAAATFDRPIKTRGPRIQQLEREGEVAADFLERLLDIADLDGDIDVDVDGDRAAVAIVDSDEGRVPRRLVGPEGRVLEALQELTRLAVQTATGERSRLMLDVAGFRAERRSTLLQLARSAIAEVRDSGQQKALPDMTAFERKVVHDEVTAAGLVSESEGVEPHRHIVILPA